MIRLVSLHKVENIGTVTELLNASIPSEAGRRGQKDKHVVSHGRTAVECMDRWLYLRNNTEDGTVKQIKGNWTPEEDMILRNKVAEFGLKKWKEVATFLPGRIGKQCRERWYNNVDPNLNKEKWTVAEDLQLMELHKHFGNKWVQIQKFMPGRIDNDIKNRFNASLRKYTTFEEYMEANDKKREKNKKKYYWRQHYELRNVNNSKRLPLNQQDKEFKDMAQQKIQMEVGSNLPPLKSDLLIEKKKELEEYQEFKKQKQQVREHKRVLKMQEKMSKRGHKIRQHAAKGTQSDDEDLTMSLHEQSRELSRAESPVNNPEVPATEQRLAKIESLAQCSNYRLLFQIARVSEQADKSVNAFEFYDPLSPSKKTELFMPVRKPSALACPRDGSADIPKEVAQTNPNPAQPGSIKDQVAQYLTNKGQSPKVGVSSADDKAHIKA